MRRFLSAAALSCVLLTNVLGGDIHTTDSPAPADPPPPPCTVPIDNSEPICESEPTPENPLVTVVLNIISAVTI